MVQKIIGTGSVDRNLANLLDSLKTLSKETHLATDRMRLQSDVKTLTRERDQWRRVALSYGKELEQLKKHNQEYHDLPDGLCEGCKWGQ